MFLTDPSPTAYDLRWRMFGIPVRVHPMFWLLAAILWPRAEKDSVALLLVWVPCVFVSILVHELGHVVAGRIFGVHGQIVLYGFGGLAIPGSEFRKRWQHVVVCFAGPIAGLFLFVLVFALPFLLPIPDNELVHRGIVYLVTINLVWSILNLFPIWPLDGGQISKDVFETIMPDNGPRIAYGISFVIAGLLAICSIVGLTGHPVPFIPGSIFNALLFGSLAFGSFQALQFEEQRRRYRDDDSHRWEYPRDDEDNDRRW